MDNQALLFEKKKSTLDGALQYAKAALETYPKAKVTIEPIEIGLPTVNKNFHHFFSKLSKFTHI